MCFTSVPTTPDFVRSSALAEIQADLLGIGCYVNLFALPERLYAIFSGSQERRLLVLPGDMDKSPVVVNGTGVDRSSADARLLEP